MRNKFFVTLSFLLLMLGASVGFEVISAEASKEDAFFTQDESGAKKMAEAAYGYYRESGLDAAIKAFNDSPIFKANSLYVFLIDSKGIILAHGNDKSFIGKDITKLVDLAGTKFGEEILKTKNIGSVEYYWVNKYADNKVQRKKTYVISDGNVWICVGIYLSD